MSAGTKRTAPDSGPALGKKNKRFDAKACFGSAAETCSWHELYQERVFADGKGPYSFRPVYKQQEILDFLEGVKAKDEKEEDIPPRNGVGLASDINTHNANKCFYALPLSMYTAWLRKLPAERRTFYEILRGPVHFYMDVEVYFDQNREVVSSLEDYDRLEKVFVRKLLAFICQWFSLPEDYVRCVTLDSSNAEKVSRHYVVRIRGAMFADNYQVGALLRQFEHHTGGDPSDPDNPWYFWEPQRKTRVGQPLDPCVDKTFWVDMSTYTKRRFLRHLGSSKKGKKRPLRVYPTPKGGLQEELTDEWMQATSILWPDTPPDDDKDATLSLLLVNEPITGKPAFSTSDRFSHRAYKRPDSVYATGSDVVVASKLVWMSTISSSEDESGGCGISDGRRRDMASGILRAVMEEHQTALKKDGNAAAAKRMPISNQGVRQSSFDRKRLQFRIYTTARYCPFLSDDTQGRRLCHKSNNVELLVDVSFPDMLLYSWKCFDDMHARKYYRWKPVPAEAQKRFAKAAREYHATLDDDTVEICELFRRTLRMEEKEEEDSSSDEE